MDYNNILQIIQNKHMDGVTVQITLELLLDGYSLTWMNQKRNTFDIVLRFVAIRTLDEGRGLDFGSYSRMLRIPKYSAWT